MSNYLRHVRESLSLSLADVARMSGVSKAHVHQLEQGTTEPSLAVAVKIARSLGVVVSHIWPDAIEADAPPASNLGALGRLTAGERLTVAQVMLTGTEYLIVTKRSLRESADPLVRTAFDRAFDRFAPRNKQ